MRKFKVTEATPETAFISDDDGYDVAVMIRLTRDPAATGFQSEAPLTDDEWQNVVDSFENKK